MATKNSDHHGTEFHPALVNKEALIVPGQSELLTRRHASSRGDSRNYVLSPEQVGDVFKIARKNRRSFALMGSLIMGGLRISEAVHIRPKWLHDNDVIAIPPFDMCGCSECVRKRDGEWRAKTRSSARRVRIPSHLHSTLQSVVIDSRSKTGFNLTRVGAWSIVKDILRRSKVRMEGRGLSGDTSFPHALRATCATILASNGASAAAICYHMGWSSLEVGEHYIKLAQAENMAHQQVGKIFG